MHATPPTTSKIPPFVGKIVSILVGLLVLGAVASLIPAPYMVDRGLAPVRVDSAVRMVGDGSSARSGSDAKIVFPVVDIHRARWIEVAFYRISGGAMVTRRRAGSSGGDTERGHVNERQLLKESQHIGAYVGIQAGGQSATMKGKGVRVWATGSHRQVKKLKSGDVIVTADGVAVRTFADLELAARLNANKNGAPFPVRLSTGKIHTLPAVPESMLDDTLLAAHSVGVAAVETDTPVLVWPKLRWKTPPEVHGTSAGLAFALAAYQEAIGPLGTSTIMATGEVTSDGGVYAVGGIEEKARSARKLDVEILVVPKENENAARKNAGGITVIGVESVAEAINVLRNISQ